MSVNPHRVDGPVFATDARERKPDAPGVTTTLEASEPQRAPRHSGVLIVAPAGNLVVLIGRT